MARPHSFLSHFSFQSSFATTASAFESLNLGSDVDEVMFVPSKSQLGHNFDSSNQSDSVDASYQDYTNNSLSTSDISQNDLSIATSANEEDTSISIGEPSKDLCPSSMSSSPIVTATPELPTSPKEALEPPQCISRARFRNSLLANSRGITPAELEKLCDLEVVPSPSYAAPGSVFPISVSKLGPQTDKLKIAVQRRLKTLFTRVSSMKRIVSLSSTSLVKLASPVPHTTADKRPDSSATMEFQAYFRQRTISSPEPHFVSGQGLTIEEYERRGSWISSYEERNGTFGCEVEDYKTHSSHHYEGKSHAATQSAGSECILAQFPRPVVELEEEC